MKKIVKIPVILCALLLSFLAFRSIQVQALDNDFLDGITVDSTLDTPDDSITNGPGADGVCDDGAGNCTLRAAIEEANENSGLNEILFAIPGTGVQTIQLNDVLPDILYPLSINGYSQPGAQANTAPSPNPFNGTLLIRLDGGSTVDRALTLSDGSSGSSIAGLNISRFNVEGISINTTDTLSDITISGNYIGTDATGLLAESIGIGIGSFGPTINNIKIGGSSPASRNIISNATTGAIASGANAGSIEVRGNYIGLDSDGLTDMGSNSGIDISNSSGYILDNVISGNTRLNVAFSGQGVRIQGNLIGTNYLGVVDSSIEQGAGIAVNQSAAEALIGGSNPGEGNVIAGNNIAGVLMSEISLPFPLLLTPSKITIIGNSIFSNSLGGSGLIGEEAPGLGIDSLSAILDGSFAPQSAEQMGVTINDAGDGDIGPNGYINFPVVSSAVQDGTGLTVNFDLDAADSPDNQYRIEFFANDTADPTDHGEGQTYLGFVTVGNGSGQVASITLDEGTDLSGKVISATTTALDSGTSSGFGSTSEFSFNRLVEVIGSENQGSGSTQNSSGSGSQGASGASKLASTGSSLAALLMALSLVLFTSGSLAFAKFMRARV